MQPNPLDLWVELMSISLGSPAGYNRKKVPKCMLSLGQTHTPDQSFLLLFGWWIEYKYLNNVQPNWIASAGAGFKIAGFTLKKAVIRNHSIFSSSFMEPSIMDSSNYKPKSFWQKKKQQATLFIVVSLPYISAIAAYRKSIPSLPELWSPLSNIDSIQSGIYHKISSDNTTLIEHFKHTNKTTVQTIKEHQRKSKEEKEKPHRIKQ